MIEIVMPVPDNICSTLKRHDYAINDAIAYLQDKVDSLGDVSTIAKKRWFKVSELEYLLNPETTPLTISTHTLRAPPRSGALLLFDRNITRNYKTDGHEWIRKRNSRKTREDHVKLRINGKCRISGFYAHSQDRATVHRRAYHLLDPNSGAAASPPGQIGGEPSLVLVHYFDTASANETTSVRSKHCPLDGMKRKRRSVSAKSVSEEIMSNGLNHELTRSSKRMCNEKPEFDESNWRTCGLSEPLKPSSIYLPIRRTPLPQPQDYCLKQQSYQPMPEEYSSSLIKPESQDSVFDTLFESFMTDERNIFGDRKDELDHVLCGTPLNEFNIITPSNSSHDLSQETVLGKCDSHCVGGIGPLQELINQQMPRTLDESVLDTLCASVFDDEYDNSLVRGDVIGPILNEDQSLINKLSGPSSSNSCSQALKSSPTCFESDFGKLWNHLCIEFGGIVSIITIGWVVRMYFRILNSRTSIL